jgi:hypothetical protein
MVHAAWKTWTRYLLLGITVAAHHGIISTASVGGLAWRCGFGWKPIRNPQAPPFFSPLQHIPCPLLHNARH